MDEFDVVVVQVQPYKPCQTRQSVTCDHFDFIVAYFQDLEEIFMSVLDSDADYNKVKMIQAIKYSQIQRGFVSIVPVV